MIKRIYDSVDKHIEREQQKILQAEKQRAAMKNFKASDHFNIGDIVVNSWGYEQTNVEFYQVIEVLNKKIRVRQIKSDLVSAVGSMSGKVMPLKDEFLDGDDDEILLLSLKADIYTNGDIKARICDPKRFYNFRKWDGQPEYCSWYY